MDNLKSQKAAHILAFKKLIIKKLEELIENPERYVKIKCEGLCYHISKWLKWNCHIEIAETHALEFLGINSYKWEFFSGNHNFPVPSLYEKNPEIAYHYTNNLWAGEYGKRRLKFCKFVLEELKQQLEKINEN